MIIDVPPKDTSAPNTPLKKIGTNAREEGEKAGKWLENYLVKEGREKNKAFGSLRLHILATSQSV